MGAQLRGAEERVALAETEVREEVSNEMAELLRGMEASYKVPMPCAIADPDAAQSMRAVMQAWLWQCSCGREWRRGLEGDPP